MPPAPTRLTYAYQVFSPGEPATIHPTYADAQRHAWRVLRHAGEGAVASVRIMVGSGEFREMEYWTIGITGKFRHHDPA